ncbi:MAG: agmatine deiminase family protein [Bryobacteraceae bacterium]|nr:agmatine deiminase family protein [Bryobacteraceae bacterium]
MAGIVDALMESRKPRYRMPAEWEPHEGTWLAWPHERSDWPGRFSPIPWVYCEIVRHLTPHERVHILVPDDESRAKARRMLRQCHVDLNAVDFQILRTNRSWIRDFGPIFVNGDDGETVITNWHFNGWAKYGDWQLDDAVPSLVAARLGMVEIQPAKLQQPTLGNKEDNTEDHKAIVLEGGSIDVNGKGSLLTTEECLLSDVQARNPGLSRQDLESVFRDFLGIRNTLWLKNGITGDDTHGHVDDLARFTDASTVVIATESDPRDTNYEPLLENLRLLREMRDQDGTPLRIVPLPMPEPVWFQDQRLPASYANFYIANNTVLVPTFNDVNDRRALDVLSTVFPDRDVRGIHCLDLVLGLGTLHCMTQQQIAPAVRNGDAGA